MSVIHQYLTPPYEQLNPIFSPWHFMKWGMDIVKKLPIAHRQRVYMLAVIDYFMKWIEADELSQVRDRKVI